jgi:hypothetical protein
MDRLAEEALHALELGVGERPQRVAAAVGCTLVLTDRRLVLVRDGASFRPKTGVHSWPVDRDLILRVSRMRRDTGRLLIEQTDRRISVFVTTAQLPEVRAIIADVRTRAYAEHGPGPSRTS